MCDTFENFSSINQVTEHELSLSSPKGLTDPGINCSLSSRSAGEAKERDLSPNFLRKAFKSRRLSPRTVIR